MTPGSRGHILHTNGGTAGLLGEIRATAVPLTFYPKTGKPPNKGERMAGATTAKVTSDDLVFDDPLGLPPVDDNDSEVMVDGVDLSKGFQWPTNLLTLPSLWFMLASDLGIVDGERKILADRAAQGHADSVKKCEVAKQVILEMMHRTREKRQKESPSGQPLFIDEGGKETPIGGYYTSSHPRTLVVNRPAEEKRSAFGIRKGREASSGPGMPYIGEAYWKRMVEEKFLDLLPKLEFKKPNLNEYRGSFGANSAADGDKLQIMTHAEKVLNDNSAERQRLHRWLKPFLKNPVCQWNGED